MSNRIQTGAVEPIQVYVIDRSGNPLTGATDLFVRVRRGSDGDMLDWDNMTFDPTAWTRLDEPLVEVDVATVPGVYEVTGGLDTGAITNPNADDDLLVTPLQDPGTDAVLPAPGELRIGQWVDDLVAAFVLAQKLDKVDSGRWKIDTVTHQMTYYDTDGTTPLLTFDLKNAAGNPSSSVVFERVPA